MIKVLSSASVAALLAVTPAVAQTSTTTPPAATQESTPAAKSQDATTPSMKSAPGEQSGTQPAPQAQTTASVTLTEEQAKQWVDKPVYSSDGKNLGEVAAFKRSVDNTVTELHADIGGFLGMGQSRIKLSPSEFKLQGDRVVLNLTEAQAKALPTIEK